MKRKTVRKRIFLSNTWMILTILLIFFLINIIIVKVYAETIEHEFQNSIRQIVNEHELEKLIEDYTIHRNEFTVIVIIDAILCVATLIFVSHFFTKRLTKRIMIPIDQLTEGAEKIRANDLTWNIEYHGEQEFEEVCETFNGMRKSIQTEQEKNEKYEKARTDMIAGISHDLRTPLTAIKGTIKGLMDGIVTSPEQQDKFIRTAYRRVGDMDVLLNQLFYMSKLETGNMPLEMKDIEISGFIKNYVKGKQELLINEGINILADTKDIKENISIDPEQFTRILDNLLENSRKYAQASPLNINISIDSKENELVITFSDNGMGVPEDKLPYIFDEFYRVDESRNRKEGNGLGLYIVKYLIEAMGGSVKAENHNGLLIIMTIKNTDMPSGNGD